MGRKGKYIFIVPLDHFVVKIMKKNKKPLVVEAVIVDPKKTTSKPNVDPVPAERTESNFERKLRERLEQSEKNTFEAREKAKEAEKKLEAAKAAEATAKAEKKTTFMDKVTFGNVVATIALVLVLLVGFVFAVSYFGGDSKKEEITAEKQEDPRMVALFNKIEEMQAAQTASVSNAAQNLLDAKAESERKLAEILEKSRLDQLESERKLAEEKSLLNKERLELLSEVERLKNSNVSVTQGARSDSRINTLSSDQTDALLRLGAKGSGPKPITDGTGPEVFSLSVSNIPGLGNVYLPNVETGRCVWGHPGEYIPAPQMRCDLPEGVSGLKWIQTPSPYKEVAGAFIFGLVPN